MKYCIKETSTINESMNHPRTRSLLNVTSIRKQTEDTKRRTKNQKNAARNEETRIEHHQPEKEETKKSNEHAENETISAQ